MTPFCARALTTDASWEGVSLAQVTYVIHFGLSWSPVKLMRRQGRLKRVDRTKALTMYYVRDTSRALPFEQLVERSIAKAEEVRLAGRLPDTISDVE